LEQEQDRHQLSELEADLRKELKQQCLGLASLERTIARQRARVRELREGDANTRYFHLKAQDRHRRKFIVNLGDGDEIAFSHDEKADVLHKDFSSIMGREEIREASINLDTLNLPALDLSGLDAPFSEEEVWAAVRDMPSDRAPGPDGFTGAFYQTAWPIIRSDIMWAVNSFHSSARSSFRCLNNALLVLLPKIPVPKEARDYRPITLVHSFAKLLSKLLANRLSASLPRLVGDNQSAFIRGRSILDNFKYVQRASVMLRRKKIPKALVKLDISKAFDTLSWPFLLEVLQARGFSNRWCSWIATLLSTASSKVLLNGSPGQPIQHCRGVRQGDPLSPMLFIIAMDVLDRLFRKALAENILQPCGTEAIKHSCSFYADDVILFATPTAREGRAIARLLDIFGKASGLHANLLKCSITPIFGEATCFTELQCELPCQIQHFPTKYLGAPLSVKSLPKSAIRPVIEKVASKLTPWHGTLMNKSGRLIIVKSVASAVPIYLIMANFLPAWAIEEIDAIRRNFLWAGGDQSARGKSMVAWPIVCRSVSAGGLGVLDFRLANTALQTRWLWLQRTDHERAWSELDIPVSAEVQAFFRASVLAVLGNGESIRFWSDSWLDGASFVCLAPNLLKLVRTRPRNARTVAQAIANRRWIQDITGTMTEPALQEYNLLWDRLERITLRPDVADTFVWRWTASGTYSARSAYKALQLGSSSLPGHKLIWKAWAPLKVKFFLWLAFLGRLWTAERRFRHGLQADATCRLCDQDEETCDHLLFRCSFSRQVWWEFLRRLSLQNITPQAGMSISEWWAHLRRQLPMQKRKGFDSLFALISWQLWKGRNARTFRNDNQQTLMVCRLIKFEGDNWIAAGATNLGCLFCEE